MTRFWSPLSAARFCCYTAGLVAVTFGLCAAVSTNPLSAGKPHLVVRPAEVELRGNFSRAQLVITEADENGRIDKRSQDVTHRAEYVSSDPHVVQVRAGGRLLAAGNGFATISIRDGDRSAEAIVNVKGVVEQPAISYSGHVAPILSKAGCNMGACHASQFGKGGFKLSVFGFEPDKDQAAIVRDRQQRRVNFLQPESSLLLNKPTMRVPHGGSKRIDPESVEYDILVAWLSAGAPPPNGESPKVVDLVVTPEERVGPVSLEQQVRVDAVYDDGHRRDVTALARFDSMDESVLQVTPDGLVTTQGPGQAPLLVRFEGDAEIATFVVPHSKAVELAVWQSNNFVDELAAAKFRELGIEPSPLCDDAAFHRRAFLDAVGTLPKVAETRAFLASDDPHKREQLVDRLLGLTGDPRQDVYNDAYASFWTLKWADLIRNRSNELGAQGMWALHNWIRESFRTNKPFDRFVHELITAKGSIYSDGPANYFRINRNTSDLAESTAQLFLGVRLQCAKCHHHPFESYSQADYYGFAAFFSRVGTKSSQEFGIFGRESVVMVRSSGEVKHPRTGKVLKPTPLGHEPEGGPTAGSFALDRRIPLADWLTSPENEFFARSIVNRYVAYLLGRGLVDPVDDMRQTNPPTNVALMDRLAAEFVANGFDIKQLMRVTMTSRLYQLDSQPAPDNESDRHFYSHYAVKRLPAEPLLDAIDSATGVQTKFKDLPPGTRAIDLPDSEYPNYFLKTFGKPRRASVCECERVADENLAQALHTLNGDTLAKKIADKSGRVARLIAMELSHDEIVDEIYLSTLCRFPTDDEYRLSREFLEESPGPKECYEDLQWALINSKQFLFVR